MRECMCAWEHACVMSASMRKRESEKEKKRKERKRKREDRDTKRERNKGLQKVSECHTHTHACTHQPWSHLTMGREKCNHTKTCSALRKLTSGDEWRRRLAASQPMLGPSSYRILHGAPSPHPIPPHARELEPWPAGSRKLKITSIPLPLPTSLDVDEIHDDDKWTEIKQ